MSFKCPYCKEDYSISFEKKEINDLISSNLENNDSLLGIQKQIENIINDININNQKSNSSVQLKNIIIIINNIMDKINKNIKTLKNFGDRLNGNAEFKGSLDNIKIYNIKGNEDWKKFLANKLFSYKDKSGNIYHSILTKASLVGDNGAFWAYSSNFHLSPFQFGKIKLIFEEDGDINKTVLLEDRKYKIIDFKNNFSIDLEDGEFGATIAKTNMGFVFGFFNSKVNYRINLEEKKQNLDLCHKVVEELALELKSMNY